ncbi:MAG TPA: hypothetical protein VHZ54_10800 [Solirubrobacterales bacterium]|jgi:hypothetical protein|nr:hypothetical protein [Solirubrobacterales bacterium]
MGIFSASASAVVSRHYTGIAFGPNGAAGTKSFSDVQSIAVDPTSGDVLVYDIAEGGRVYKFDAAGEPVAFSGLSGSNVIESIGGATEGGTEQVAVAPSGAPGGTAGDIYVANNATVKVYSAAGLELGSLGEGETCGVAVDPAGHLFIGSYPSTISEYIPSASPPTDGDLNATGSAAIELCNVAADGTGRIYATNYTGGRIARLETIGDPSPTLIEPGARTIAADPVTHMLFADRGEVVAEYEPTGAVALTFGGGQLTSSRGVAVKTDSDEVYASDSETGKVKVFGPVGTFPDVVTAPATEVSNSRAVLGGNVNPDGVALTECKFEYGLTTSVGFEEAPCSPVAGEIPADSTAHAVSAAVTGLQANATYRFRLVATNANGGTEGKVQTFTTIGPPLLSDIAALDASQTAATIEGKVNPSGFGTSYRFEWGPTNAYGNQAPAEFEPFVGEGTRPFRVSAKLSGLSPATTYHYRLVAHSSAGTTISPDQTLETLNSCGLPEGRCYELVSRREAGPVAIPGEFITALEMHWQAATSGTGLAYVAEAGYPEATIGAQVLYRAFRGPTEWESTQATPPLSGPNQEPGGSARNGPTEWLANNLSCGFLPSNRLLTDDPATRLVTEYGNANLYRLNPDNTHTVVTALAPENPELSEAMKVVGASQNCSKVVFDAGYKYRGVEAAKGGAVAAQFLYEWQEGTLRAVGFIPAPGGQEVAVPAYAGSPFGGADQQNVVSEDGSRVFFIAERLTSPNPEEVGPGREGLFVRENGTKTRDVSESETAVPDNSPQYQWATPDGSRVYFLAASGLTTNSSPVGGSDLYEYDLETKKLTDLTVWTDPEDPSIGPEVRGLVAGANNGSRVYFAARGQLVPGRGNTYAQNVAEDTYSIFSVADGEYSYVGKVEQRSIAHTVIESQTEWSSQTTADGRYLIFESGQNITGYVGGEEEGENRAMVYLYDAEKGSDGTVCVSCRQDGEPSVAPNGLFKYEPLPTGEAVSNVLHPVRYLAESEGRPLVFFASPDSLAPGAIARQNNLYEWSHGQVFRLTSALPGQNLTFPYYGRFATLGGVADDGSNVYFGSPETLNWEDGDGRISVYDARIGGGYPEPSPPATAPCDPSAENSCQAPPQQAGSVPGAVTPALTGEQNTRKKKSPNKKKPKKKSKKKHKGKKSKGKNKRNSKRHANGNRRAGK